MSGAVPLPAAHPLGRAAGVPRPVCPEYGRCGPGDPAAAPQRAPLRAGIARTGLGGRASPGGVPFAVVRGVWGQALPLPRPPFLWGGQSGFRDPCALRATGAGVGTQHWSHCVRPCGGALLAVEVAKGRPRGGCLSPLRGASEVRRTPSLDCPPSGRAVRVRRPRAVGAGVRVWGPGTVPLACMPCGGCVPRGWRGAVPGGGGLPPFCGASGVKRCPSPGRPSSGAGRLGSATRVFRLRSVRAWRPGRGPTACPLCVLALLAVGVAEGRLKSGAPPPPTARPLGGLSGSITHVLWAEMSGCGGPALFPWLACPVGGVCRGGGGGPSPGGMACHRCEGGLVSGAVPFPAACPPGRAAWVPRPVCPGCGRCGRGDAAPAPQHASLWAGVARCGGGGRASPGGVPFTVVRGVLGQALPLPRLPALWAGCRGPPPTCCGRGCAGVGARQCPLGLHALFGAACHGGGGGPSLGGLACHRCEGHLVSGAVPPPAARPLGLAAGVRRSVCPGCGRHGHGDPARAPQRAPLRARVARCGGGGRASPGGVPFTVVRGVWGQALPLH